VRGRERLCTYCSEMKDADDVLSSNALASTVKLSGAMISTQQVMSDFNFVVAGDPTGVSA